MTRRIAVALLVPLLMLLAACTPSGPAPSSAPSATPLPAASASPIADVSDGEELGADRFLLQGGMYDDPDGDGLWSAHYGFYVEKTKAVRCDIFIWSLDAPGLYCSIVLGHEGEVTYDLPTTEPCDLSASAPFDGYTLALVPVDIIPNAHAGWLGCQEMTEPNWFTEQTRMLEEGESITVEPFACEIALSIARCRFIDQSATIEFGLHHAEHEG